MMKLLYSHGFASSRDSKKGRAFDARFPGRVERLNLRVPSFEHLRLSAMIDVVTGAIGGPRDRAVVVGSSLGGLTSARAAERDPRIIACVLMAPAFQIAMRWREQLGPAWDEWQKTGSREVRDYTTNAPARVDFGFMEDVMAIDVGFPDLQVPTLIFHGTGDDVVPIDHSRRFVADKPHVTLVELDDDHELATSTPRILDEASAWLVPWLGKTASRI